MKRGKMLSGPVRLSHGPIKDNDGRTLEQVSVRPGDVSPAVEGYAVLAPWVSDRYGPLVCWVRWVGGDTRREGVSDGAEA